MTSGSESSDGGGSPPPAPPVKSGTSGSNDSNPINPPKSLSALQCDRILASLQDCAKKHPTQQDTICAHLHRAAGWCLIRVACPVQVEDLEGCVGVVNQRSKMPVGPPLVPDRCRKQALKLEMCIAAHQVDPRNN
ncbi:hypothetical protein Ndes2526B_g07542 [Nannochloris sp. 'desiccata']|nr:hypothetical protein NADE_004080 [Chlorella desiccata (nom. nud.)]